MYVSNFEEHLGSKVIAKTNVKEFFSLFSFRSFTISGLTFKWLIHFKLIFVDGVR